MATIETLLALANETKDEALRLLLEGEKEGKGKVLVNYNDPFADPEETISLISPKYFHAKAEIVDGGYSIEIPIEDSNRVAYFRFFYSKNLKSSSVSLISRIKPPEGMIYISDGALSIIARGTCSPRENKIPGLEKIMECLDKKAKARGIKGEYIIMRPNGEVIVEITDETKKVDFDVLLSDLDDLENEFSKYTIALVDKKTIQS